MPVDLTAEDVGLGLLLRLLHQQWTQAIDEVLAAAGFDGIRPAHANVFTFVPPEGIQVSELGRPGQRAQADDGPGRRRARAARLRRAPARPG